MKNITVFSVLLLSAAVATIGTTITTAIQIQPAYSQATHCILRGSVLSTCITPGKDPTSTVCVIGECEDIPLTHQRAGQGIGAQHQTCAQAPAPIVQCTVSQEP
jgi:hypothetical protein